MTQPTTGGINLNRRGIILLAAVFAGGLLLGALVLGRGGESPSSEPAGVHAAGKAEVWTCSMHPQIQLPEPGKCPICFMDLIPVGGDDEDLGPTRLAMSEGAMKLAEVVTVPVRRGYEEAEVRAVGRVAVDESRLKKITARVGGRLDRLYVDYTGIRVSKGDHLVQIYSPQLYSTQAELIQALAARERLAGSDTEFIRRTAETTVAAAREKLRLLGLTQAQITEIEKQGRPTEHITLYAPIEGIVVHKAAVEGAYVDTGSPIYTIAELSQVWVMLDIYESDLVWIHYGQPVQFEVEALPGRRFEGKIAFIDPSVDPRTRTVKVRVNAQNRDLLLKPEMFVRAVIRTRILGEGRILAPELAGKWICPMHPEVVKARPGTCDLCEMPLVPAASLGLVADTSGVVPPLVVPVTAPLVTGKRAVVYVKVPGMQKPTFEGREIVLGPRAGNVYIVESGLAEGEEVVVKGNFKIDSAMQIQAKPSMMSPGGGRSGAAAPSTAPDHEHGVPEAGLAALRGAPEAFRHDLGRVYRGYFALQTALAEDAFAGAAGAAGEVRAALAGVPTAPLGPPAKEAWTTVMGAAEDILRHLEQSGDLAGQRTWFEPLSGLLIELDRAVGPPDGEAHHLVFCPMAFENRGAYWLQEKEAVRNPYFGASMLKCGEVRETFRSGPGE